MLECNACVDLGLSIRNRKSEYRKNNMSRVSWLQVVMAVAAYDARGAPSRKRTRTQELRSFALLPACLLACLLACGDSKTCRCSSCQGSWSFGSLCKVRTCPCEPVGLAWESAQAAGPPQILGCKRLAASAS